MANEKPQSKPVKTEAQPAPRSGSAPSGESRGTSVNFSTATPARVEEVVGRTGTRGEVTQVRCKVLDGRDANKTLRRNVRGPIQLGDIVMLRETEYEAQKMGQGRR